MKYASKTITGRRKENEDGCRIPSRETTYPLVAVSDGMGGHVAGAVASTLTLNTLSEELSDLHDADPLAALARAVQYVNLTVFRAAADDASLSGMGATLVCALLGDRRYIAANVGDSRLYHLSGNTIERITADHSYVQMLFEAGVITLEETYTHPQRNLITRAIGIGMRVEADIFDCEWMPGDMLLLCSDGLTGVLTDNAIRDLLVTPATLDEKCERLVQTAFDEGSTDNITVVLAENEGGDCA